MFRSNSVYVANSFASRYKVLATLLSLAALSFGAIGTSNASAATVLSKIDVGNSQYKLVLTAANGQQNRIKITNFSFQVPNNPIKFSVVEEGDTVIVDASASLLCTAISSHQIDCETGWVPGQVKPALQELAISTNDQDDSILSSDRHSQTPALQGEVISKDGCSSSAFGFTKPASFNFPLNINAGAGADYVSGGCGSDYLNGGSGTDRVVSDGDDLAKDTVDCSDDEDQYRSDSNDIVTNCEKLGIDTAAQTGTGAVSTGTQPGGNSEVASVGDRLPSSQIRKPAKAVLRTKRLKVLRGTAVDDKAVMMVKLSITKKSGKQRCLALKSNGKFRVYKTMGGRCKPKFLLAAKGTTSWIVKLKKALPRGDYGLRSQAIDNQNQRETTQTKGNYITLRVK